MLNQRLEWSKWVLNKLILSRQWVYHTFFTVTKRRRCSECKPIVHCRSFGHAQMHLWNYRPAMTLRIYWYNVSEAQYQCKRQIAVCYKTIIQHILQNASAKLHYTDTGYGHVVQHHQRMSSQQFYSLLYNKFTTNGQKFAESQYLDSWHVEMLGSRIAMWQIFVSNAF